MEQQFVETIKIKNGKAQLDNPKTSIVAWNKKSQPLGTWHNPRSRHHAARLEKCPKHKPVQCLTHE